MYEVSTMLIAKVIGTVVSTRKHDALTGSKLLIIETIEEMKDDNKRLVAIDSVGAGIGDTVLVTCGSSARLAHYNQQIPTDAAIVGIIDNENEIYIDC